MYSKMNGYQPFRSSGGRMWGMSHSLPSGMSHYAATTPTGYYQQQLQPQPQHYQDADFTSSYPSSTGGGGRRWMDFPTSSSALGAVGHVSSSSTSSLTGCGVNGGSNLIINYLPQDMSERELYSLFATMGPIETCKIMRDFKTGYSYGFGFINFSTEEAALRSIKCLNGLTVRNKRLKVSFARPPGDDIKETNLYVTNLPKTITEEQLDIIFGKYGQIVQKNILRDKITGKPRGIAFVRFNKREEAQEAISALNNVIPQGGNQPLSVRVAEDHGRAKAQVYMPPSQSTVLNRGRLRQRPSRFPY